MIRNALLNRGIYCTKETFLLGLAMATVDIKANNVQLGKRTNLNQMLTVLERSVNLIKRINGEIDLEIVELFDSLPEPEYDLKVEIQWNIYRAALMREIKKAGINQQK